MLNREEIRALIKKRGLVRGYIDLETQLTPNGFDLTVKEIFGFREAGSLDFSNQERVLPRVLSLPARRKKPADAYGWWSLKPGAYKIVCNEILRLPQDLTGIAFPRSSLLRMGAFTQTGVWDAGFNGKSEFILVVGNPGGMRVKQNSRIIQLVFSSINETASGYCGIYQRQERKGVSR